MIAIIFLILVSFSAGIFFYKGIKLEESLPYTFMGIVLILFVFGLIKLLKFGVYFICLLSFVSWVYSVYKFIKNDNKLRCIKDILTPGFVFFVVMFIFLCVLHNGRLITFWDEFSHWGDVVKAMYTINDFSTNPLSLSSGRTYLPGVSLFQYFFQVLAGKFNEGYLFVALQTLSISMFLPFMKNLNWKNIYKFILSIMIIMISFFMLFDFFKEIYVDCFLGLMLAFNFTSIYIMKNKYNRINLIKMALSLSMLVLTKEMGVFFGMIIVFIVFVVRCISSILKKRLILKDYLPVIYFLIVVLGTYFIWQLNIKYSSIEFGWSKPIDIKFIIDSLTGSGTGYGVQVTKNYLKAVRFRKITFGFIKNDCAMLLISCIVIMVLIYFKDNKKDRLNHSVIMIISILCFFVYVFFMLIIYLWKFDEYEALNLSSWERYIPTYLQALLFFISALVVYMKNDRKKVSIIMVILLVLLGLSINWERVAYNLAPDAKKTISKRKEYDKSAVYLKSKLKDKRVRIYYISQQSSGYDYWAFKFVARDNISYINDSFSWSIGKKYGHNDLWTLEIDSEEWKNVLIKDYEYVYLFKVDDMFIYYFGNLFQDKNAIKDNKLFKIDINSEKLIEVM